MAQFKSVMTTTKGQELIAKILAGSDNITFTRIVTSSQVYAQEQIADLITLAGIKQYAPVSGVTVVDTTSVKIEGAINNAELTEGYLCNTVGVYANDSDENEILFGVTTVNGQADFIPAFSNAFMSGIAFDLTIAIGNTANVTLEVDPAALVTAQQLENVQTQIAEIESFIDGEQLEKLTNKGEADGYAGLDANKKLLLENMPDAIIGQMIHAGEVNAATMIATLTTNGQSTLGTTAATITLTNDTAATTGYPDNQGNYYIVTAAGTFASYAFAVGDWILANASGWGKVDNTDAVTSVNNQTGAVTIDDASMDATLVDAPESSSLPVTGTLGLRGVLQGIRNSLKYLFGKFSSNGVLGVPDGGTGQTSILGLLGAMGTAAPTDQELTDNTQVIVKRSNNVLRYTTIGAIWNALTGSTGTALPISKGGTQATNVTDARANLGAAGIGHVHALSDNSITGVLPLNKGGTGALLSSNNMPAFLAMDAMATGIKKVSIGSTGEFIPVSRDGVFGQEALPLSPSAGGTGMSLVTNTSNTRLVYMPKLSPSFAAFALANTNSLLGATASGGFVQHSLPLAETNGGTGSASLTGAAGSLISKLFPGAGEGYLKIDNRVGSITTAAALFKDLYASTPSSTLTPARIAWANSSGDVYSSTMIGFLNSCAASLISASGVITSIVGINSAGNMVKKNVSGIDIDLSNTSATAMHVSGILQPANGGTGMAATTANDVSVSSRSGFTITSSSAYRDLLTKKAIVQISGVKGLTSSPGVAFDVAGISYAPNSISQASGIINVTGSVIGDASNQFSGYGSVLGSSVTLYVIPTKAVLVNAQMNFGFECFYD